jgi:hypothetical protein
MRHVFAVLALLIVQPAAPVAAATPGDVAPAGAPDGVVDVADVLLGLSMSVGSAPVDLAADVAPSTAFGSSRLIRGDEAVDVQDVLLLLRVAVGIDTLAGGVDVDPGVMREQVQAARFGFDGFWTVLTDAITLDEIPPLNTPTDSPCADSGKLTVLLGFSAQSIEAFDCDTGDFVINGTASRAGSLLDPVFDADLDLSLVHPDGTLRMTGEMAREADVEFEPGRSGALVTGRLDVGSSYPTALTMTLEIDTVDPNDGDWPIGTTWAVIDGGVAVELTFDGSSTATAAATDGSTTRGYLIDLETGAVTERP